MLRSVALALLLPLPGLAAPAVNLLVELRWVPQALAPAAQAGVRDGAVVVGTAGSVSPRGAVVLGTQASRVEAAQRLTVLNGATAQIQIERREPVQWLDLAAEVAPDTRQPTKVWALPRSGERLSGQTYTVTPTWPGGAAPVRVRFEAQGDAAQAASTALVPLDAWTAVARLASPATASQSTVTSSAAAPVSTQELQLRISRAP